MAHSESGRSATRVITMMMKKRIFERRRCCQWAMLAWHAMLVLSVRIIRALQCGVGWQLALRPLRAPLVRQARQDVQRQVPKGPHRRHLHPLLRRVRALDRRPAAIEEGMRPSQ